MASSCGYCWPVPYSRCSGRSTGSIGERGPQSLHAEDRDLFLTITLQIGIVIGAAGLTFDPLEFDRSMLVVFVGMLLAVAGNMWTPEAKEWVVSRAGYPAVLGNLPTVVTAAGAIVAIEGVDLASGRTLQFALGVAALLRAGVHVVVRTSTARSRSSPPASSCRTARRVTVCGHHSSATSRPASTASRYSDASILKPDSVSRSSRPTYPSNPYVPRSRPSSRT